MEFIKYDNEDLNQFIITELKILGVKVPKVKKFKRNILKQDASVSEKENKLFGVKLSDQEWVSHGNNNLPKFISVATSYLQEFTDKEGLFRKAGNVARQRKLREKLEKGENLQDADPNDVACLLKQWLRELPEPLIPFYLQTLFMRCQNLDSEEDCTSACLLSCLLMPSGHLYSLKHILQFLADVASNSNKSKMCTYNLALIMAPNIFAPHESIDKVSSYTNNLVHQHTAVVKILIDNSDKIGDVPCTISLGQSLLRPEITTTLDSTTPNKYKRRLKNDIISGFRRLVGQQEATAINILEGNIQKTPFPKIAFKRKADPDLESMSPTKKQALCANDLDNSSLTVTPNLREIYSNNETGNNGHTRRKSIAALLLRRKNKKRNKTPKELKELTNGEKNRKDQKDSPEKLESFQKLSDIKLSNRLLNNFVPSPNESNVSSVFYDDLKQLEPQLPPVTDSELKNVSSCESTQPESKPTELELSCSKRTKDVREETAILQNDVASFQNVDIIGYKTVSFQAPEERKSSDSTSNIRKIRSKESIKTCLHKQTSGCNTKCDKNKAAKDEELPERTRKGKTVARVQSVPTRISRKSKLPEQDNHLLKYTSPVSLGTNQDYNSKSNYNYDNSSFKMSVGQSLDVSLSLMLQNFCLSPPKDSKEIRVTIGITSNKNTPELKLDISENEISSNQKKTPRMTGKSSRNRTSRGKSRGRLSSNSDSHIHRPRKSCESRPKSFSGNHMSRNLNIHKPAKPYTHTVSSFAKTPLTGVKSEPLILPNKKGSISDNCFTTSCEQLSSNSDSHILKSRKPLNITPNSFGARHLSSNLNIYNPQRQSKHCISSLTKTPLVCFISEPPNQGESMSDSCFKTPRESFTSPDSVFQANDSHYLSAYGTPDDICNKRESISRILKENNGHVKEKISLYDCRAQNESTSSSSAIYSENGKLLRAASERYPPRYRYKTSLCNSNSYDAAKRSGSLQSKPFKYVCSPPPKFVLTNLDTPSPISNK